MIRPRCPKCFRPVDREDEVLHICPASAPKPKAKPRKPESERVPRPRRGYI